MPRPLPSVVPREGVPLCLPALKEYPRMVPLRPVCRIYLPFLKCELVPESILHMLTLFSPLFPPKIQSMFKHNNRSHAWKISRWWTTLRGWLAISNNLHR